MCSKRTTRRHLLKTGAIVSAGVFARCGFKYRGLNRHEPIGEGEDGFLAQTAWLKPGYVTLVYLKEGDPVLIANVNGRFKAYRSICPHTNCELNDGERFQPIKNNEIRCFIHDSYFSLETGACLRGPALKRGPLRSALLPFKIDVREGKIYRAFQSHFGLST